MDQHHMLLPFEKKKRCSAVVFVWFFITFASITFVEHIWGEVKMSDRGTNVARLHH